GHVCEFAPCTCTGSGKSCVPGCQSPGDCGDGKTCINHHCQPLPCSSPTQCPKYFKCVLPPVGGGGAQCQRLACHADGDCSGGDCVDGACYGTLGTCILPPQ